MLVIIVVLSLVLRSSYQIFISMDQMKSYPNLHSLRIDSLYICAPVFEQTVTEGNKALEASSIETVVAVGFCRYLIVYFL